MSDENNSTTLAETVAAANALETVLSAFDFESPDARATRSLLEELKVKELSLTEKVTALDKEDNAQKSEATRLAKRLLKSGLGTESVAAVMAIEFGKHVRKAAPAASSEPRKNHKLAADAPAEILAFISTHADGVAAQAIWAHFVELDKPGISIAVKHLVEGGRVRATGNTRQRLYFPAA